MKASTLSNLQDALKPCPHCGGGGRLAPMPSASQWFQVRCSEHDCGATTWAMQGAQEAAAAWNRRVSHEQA